MMKWHFFGHYWTIQTSVHPEQGFLRICSFIRIFFPNLKLPKSTYFKICTMYLRGCQKFLSLKFQKARTKIEVALTLPCWLSQLN